MAKADTRHHLLMGLTLLWAVLLLAIGIWWLYLIFKFGALLDKDMALLIKWEGGTFFILLIALSSSLFFLYNRDRKKAKGLQAFFATMTHELKTPLASIRLQVEVIKDLFKKNDDPMVVELSQRLIEDTQKLETQMDKILQLSRIERGGVLNPVVVDLKDFVYKTHRYWGRPIEVHGINQLDGIKVFADEFALELIFRNLFENTKDHTDSSKAKIEIHSDANNQIISYSDQGVFKGDSKKLGELFYKHDSSRGSGIGIYLIKKLCQRMGGDLKIKTSPLLFQLTLPKPQEVLS